MVKARQLKWNVDVNQCVYVRVVMYGTCYIVTWPARPSVRPIADLNDFEEMMLSLVHPFVQVYTIPTTGELAFAGHVCNFRQKVHEWVKELPVRPKNMPYVLVKPRPNHTDPDQRPRLPFAIDVQRVRKAYEWLKKYNVHYKDIEWSEDNARAWTDGIEEVPTREEDITQHLSSCSMTLFKKWMSRLEQGEAEGQEQTASWKCRRAFGMDSDVDELWTNVKYYMGGHYRVVTSLTSLQLYRAIFAKTHYPEGENLGEALQELQECGEWEDGWEKEDCDQWPEGYKQLLSELVASRIAMEEEMGAKEQHELGAVQPEEPEGDEEERLNAIEAFDPDRVQNAADSKPRFVFEGGASGGEGRGADEEQDTREPMKGDAESGDATVEVSEEGHLQERTHGAQNRRRMDRRTRKATPKVDAPRVDEKDPIREDENDYIAKAFVKIFPFGLGDYYTKKNSMQAAPSFADWAKYVLQYHDGRASRHPRFKYFCLNTRLRVKAPGMRKVFYRLNDGYQDLNLSDMKSADVRRALLYKMSTVTATMPGSVGEKAKNRQELETMVEQKEAETAEAGENGGLGRTPALFTTCTTAPYKWEQLHAKILQSLLPIHREKYERWKDIEDAVEREKERKTCYWEAATENPAVVSWYSAWRLEATLKTIMQSLTVAMQKLDRAEECKSCIRKQLRQCLGVRDAELVLHEPTNWGEIDDYWATYEWSEGGLIHLHIAFWVVGSPRVDVVKLAEEEDRTNEAGKVVKEFYFEDEPQVMLESEPELQHYR